MAIIVLASFTRPYGFRDQHLASNSIMIVIVIQVTTSCQQVLNITVSYVSADVSLKHKLNVNLTP